MTRLSSSFLPNNNNNNNNKKSLFSSSSSCSAFQQQRQQQQPQQPMSSSSLSSLWKDPNNNERSIRRLNKKERKWYILIGGVIVVGSVVLLLLCCFVSYRNNSNGVGRQYSSYSSTYHNSNNNRRFVSSSATYRIFGPKPIQQSTTTMSFSTMSSSFDSSNNNDNSNDDIDYTFYSYEEQRTFLYEHGIYCQKGFLKDILLSSNNNHNENHHHHHNSNSNSNINYVLNRFDELPLEYGTELFKYCVLYTGIHNIYWDPNTIDPYILWEDILFSSTSNSHHHSNSRHDKNNHNNNIAIQIETSLVDFIPGGGGSSSSSSSSSSFGTTTTTTTTGSTDDDDDNGSSSSSSSRSEEEEATTSRTREKEMKKPKLQLHHGMIGILSSSKSKICMAMMRYLVLNHHLNPVELAETLGLYVQHDMMMNNNNKHHHHQHDHHDHQQLSSNNNNNNNNKRRKSSSSSSTTTTSSTVSSTWTIYLARCLDVIPGITNDGILDHRIYHPHIVVPPSSSRKRRSHHSRDNKKEEGRGDDDDEQQQTETTALLAPPCPLYNNGLRHCCQVWNNPYGMSTTTMDVRTPKPQQQQQQQEEEEKEQGSSDNNSSPLSGQGPIAAIKHTYLTDQINNPSKYEPPPIPYSFVHHHQNQNNNNKKDDDDAAGANDHHNDSNNNSNNDSHNNHNPKEMTDENLAMSVSDYPYIATIRVERTGAISATRYETPNFFDILASNNCLPHDKECFRCLKTGYNNEDIGGDCYTCKHVCPCYCNALCNIEIPPKRLVAHWYVQKPYYKYDPTRLIPKIIHQTWYEPVTKESYPNMSRLIESFRQSGYTYEFYDDHRAGQFLSSHFPPEVREAYDTVIPGAFKADLFRYCVLLIRGGIYADMDIMLESNLNTMIENDIGYFVPQDSPGQTIQYGNVRHCLWNGFMGSSPGHPFLAQTIQLVVNNIRNRYTSVDYDNMLCPHPILSVAHTVDTLFTCGPCILGVAMNDILHRHRQTGYIYGEIDIYETERKKLIQQQVQQQKLKHHHHHNNNNNDANANANGNGGGGGNGNTAEASSATAAATSSITIDPDDPRLSIPGRVIMLKQNKEDMGSHRFSYVKFFPSEEDHNKNDDDDDDESQQKGRKKQKHDDDDDDDDDDAPIHLENGPIKGGNGGDPNDVTSSSSSNTMSSSTSGSIGLDIIIAATDMPEYDDRPKTLEHYSKTHEKFGIYGLHKLYTNNIRANEEIQIHII